MNYEDLKKVNKEIKTTPIKGKEYANVNERVTAFRKLFPDGFIITDIVSNDGGVAVITAKVGFYREDGSMQILATGTAYEREGATNINKTSYIENCETSAIGRALGMAGIGVVASIASADEVANAIVQQNAPQAAQVTYAAPQDKPSFVCVACGKTFYDARYAKATMDKWGKHVCRSCVEAKKKAHDEAEKAKAEAAAKAQAQDNSDLPFEF